MHKLYSKGRTEEKAEWPSFSQNRLKKPHKVKNWQITLWDGILSLVKLFFYGGRDFFYSAIEIWKKEGKP